MARLPKATLRRTWHARRELSETELPNRFEIRVRYPETDQMGVVYHANYLAWCDIGRTELIRDLGTSYAALEAQGVLLAVADASLRFHASARYDDIVRIETTVEQVRSRAVTFAYEIRRRDPAPEIRLVTARTTLVALDRSGSPRTLPPTLVTALRTASRDSAGGTYPGLGGTVPPGEHT